MLIHKITYLVVSAFFLVVVYWSYNKKQCIESVIFSFSIYLLNNMVIGTTLACIYPLFSIQGLSIALLMETILLFIYICNKKINRPCMNIAINKWNILLFTIFVFFLFLYWSFPTEYLDGGRDPGLYYIQAIRISNTGGWLFDYDAILDKVYTQYGVFLRKDGYPGLYLAHAYGLEDKSGILIPQFLPAAPSLFAVAYSIGGFYLLNRINGIVGIITLCLLYLIIKRDFHNQWVALLATSLLGISPAYIWNVRETTTEIIVLFLVVLAIYVGGDNKRQWKNYILEGMLLGFVGIVRIDACILSVVVVFREILSIIICCNNRKQSLCRLSSYLGMMGVCVCYTYYYSYPYFLIHEQFLKPAYICAIGLLIIYILVIMISKYCRFICFKTVVEKFFRQKSILLSVFLFLFYFFKIAYFYRPTIENAGFNERALVEFSWYTSIITIMLAIIGIVILLYNFEIVRRNLLLLIYGFAYFIIYIYTPSISEDHMWASRRWVSAAIPIIFICASYAIIWMRKYIKTGILVIIICIVGYLLYQDNAFLFKPMMKDIHLSYDNYAETLNDNYIYFTDNGYVASVLRYVYGKRIYIVTEPELMQQYLKTTGESIYFITESERNDLEYNLISTGEIKYCMLEKTVKKMPQKMENIEHILNVYKVFFKY